MSKPRTSPRKARPREKKLTPAESQQLSDGLALLVFSMFSKAAKLEALIAGVMAMQQPSHGLVAGLVKPKGMA